VEVAEQEELKLNEAQKTSFYAAEDYLLHHKSILKKELKAVIRKHALSMVENHRAHSEAQYQLY